MKKLNRKGFTLIELLAVIVVLAIILVVAIPSVLSSMDKAKESQLQNAANTVAEWMTKQHEIKKLGTVAGTVDAAYPDLEATSVTVSNPATVTSALSAAGISDTTGLTGTAYLSGDKACVILRASSGSQFFVTDGDNEASSSACQ